MTVVFWKTLNCILFLFIITCLIQGSILTENDKNILPTIMIAILVRNKEHALPYFFGYLERLDYPKDRISLWIRSDHNIDNSVEVINTWLDVHEDLYHSVDFEFSDDPSTFSDASEVFEWTTQRYEHVIKLKEDAMLKAIKMWADYILFLDCDAFLVYNQTLQSLIAEQKTLVAPLMDTLGAYSNFWCGMTEQGYYKRTDDYLPILEREVIGSFEVPMIHSVFLIDLQKRESRNLTFDLKKISSYNGQLDDILIFAYSARKSGIKMYVTNKQDFGYMLSPQDKSSKLENEKEQLIYLKVEMMVANPEVKPSPALEHFVPKTELDTLGLDQIYLINLERRPLRRQRMLNTLTEIGIKAQLLPAVDGKRLNDSYLNEHGIRMLPEYADPYHKRPVTRGEIGCFLSHYNIWKDMINHQHRIALVLEDDLRFEPHFRNKVKSLLKEVQKIGLLWDLIYLGRKRLSEVEPFVHGSSSLVHVDYTYWTLCYLISLEGAKKLVGAEPLSKMVPVDEYLPIMFDKHPQTEWKERYPQRNLRAFSAHPLLVYPTHYTGQENYISDTEDSDIATSIIKDEL